MLTDEGRQPYDEAGRLQAPWANRLSEDLAIKDIDTTRRVVAELRRRLELSPGCPRCLATTTSPKLGVLGTAELEGDHDF